MSYDQDLNYKPKSKLRLLIEECDSMSNEYNGWIPTGVLLRRLCKKGFTPIEAMEYILTAENNGQIYERDPGIWARP